MNARTRFGMLIGVVLVTATFSLACGDGDGAISEEECAAYTYATFVRERAETGGDCGSFPTRADDAFDTSEMAPCDGGFDANVCSYRFSWDCPGEDGQTLVYEGIVSWNANERTGYGGSAVTIKDRDGNVVCQSTYDEAWAGDEPTPETE